MLSLTLYMLPKNRQHFSDRYSNYFLYEYLPAYHIPIYTFYQLIKLIAIAINIYQYLLNKVTSFNIQNLNLQAWDIIFAGKSLIPPPPPLPTYTDPSPLAGAHGGTWQLPSALVQSDHVTHRLQKGPLGGTLDEVTVVSSVFTSRAARWLVHSMTTMGPNKEPGKEWL